MSEINFDQIFDRRNTACAKWDEMDEKYGTADLIHLGVADMDFQAPKQIRDTLSTVIEYGVFGYTNLSNGFYASIQRWIKKRIGEDIPKEWIVFCPRINISSSISIAVLTEPGDKVIMHAPYYMPLHNAVTKNHRELLESPLKLADGRYEIDFVQMESLVDEKTKMLVLCNPHNPCCRSWNAEEMGKLADFCIRHDLLLFSDEIHSDIRPEGKEFVSALNMKEALKERLIYVNSPTKTFNIPGVILSYMIIPNPLIREAVANEIDRIGMHNPTSFANAAIQSGYCDCDTWLHELNAYIDSNEKYVRDYMSTQMPGFCIMPREGTYLLWIDCRELHISDEELEKWFVCEAGVSVYRGDTFGSFGTGFIRLNLGTSKSLLEEAMKRMKHVYHKIDRERKI